MIPPPLYIPEFDMRQDVINEKLEPIIRRVANATGVPSHRVISIFDALGGKKLTKPDCFFDHCHPNDKGYQIMAQTIYDAIKDEL